MEQRCVCVCALSSGAVVECVYQFVEARERQSDEGVHVSASQTERRYIWGCSSDEGPLDYDQTISALIGVSPSSYSLSLNPLLYLDGTLENLIVTQHLTKTKVSVGAAGDDWPDGVRSRCAEYPSHSLSHSRLACFPLGEAGDVGSKERQETQASVCIYAHRWHERPSTQTHISCTEVRQFLSLPPWIQCLHTFNISPDRQTAASSVLSAEPG